MQFSEISKNCRSYLVKISVFEIAQRLIINEKKKKNQKHIDNIKKKKRENIYTLFTLCTENQLY